MIDETKVMYFIKAFVSILVIFNPLLNLPVFIAYTAHLSNEEQQNTVKKAMKVASFLVVICALIGGPLLDILSISLPALQFTGCILIGKSAYDMIVCESDDNSCYTSSDASVYPLAIPLLAGPGTFSFVISYMKQAESYAMQGIILCIVLLVLLTSYLILSLGCRYGKIYLTKETVQVIRAVSGTILLSVALQSGVNATENVALKIFSYLEQNRRN